ncbi:hypothetical protein [Alteribacter populi]|uniref:hypothetical protein n=1 Tax=Alteribacter populi TaxID=2011011 RepID=UPI000BBA4C5B|nr:hypothetical protein [Alteribacter populi]
MEIQVINYTPTPQRQKVYYPHLLTTWTAEYRSVFGDRSEKVALMTNLVKGGTGFATTPSTSKLEALPKEVLPAVLSLQDAEEEAYEMLRRYYMHKARSWKVPKFEHHSTVEIYVPYEYFVRPSRWLKKDRTYLHEPVSQYDDLLKKYPEIETFIEDVQKVQ